VNDWITKQHPGFCKQNGDEITIKMMVKPTVATGEAVWKDKFQGMIAIRSWWALS
jgi:hypothetical protein